MILHYYVCYLSLSILYCVNCLQYAIIPGVGGKPAEPTAMSRLDEYRGANKWKGLIPSPGKDRVWDEGFRSFLVK